MALWFLGATRAEPDWRDAAGYFPSPGAGRQRAGVHFVPPRRRRCWLSQPTVRLLLALDQILRYLEGIDEFSRDGRCILRAARMRARKEIRLKPLSVPAGAPFLEIHLWNEHVPEVPRTGADFGWARRMQRASEGSLRELAAWLAREDARVAPVAIRARTAFARRGQRRKIVAVMCAFGFEAVPARNLAFFRLAAQFWGDVWVTALVWTFNPPSLKSDTLMRARTEFWISREALIARYGPQAKS